MHDDGAIRQQISIILGKMDLFRTNTTRTRIKFLQTYATWSANPKRVINVHRCLK